MNKTKYKQLLYGSATMLPLINAGLRKIYYNQTGGTSSAAYCYSVWLRHLVLACDNGMKNMPKVVAELGPGDSIGIGLSALLSGVEKYFAFDILKYGSVEKNMKIFEELVQLFKSRAPISKSNQFANLKPNLGDYSFPHHILDKSVLRNALDSDRIAKIKKAIREINVGNDQNSLITYKVPWFDEEVIEVDSVDYCLSQSVLEYIENIEEIFKKMKSWLCPGGLMSHQIDLACMRTADTWDGHWTYSDLEWKIMKGKRPFFINRLPNSIYEKLLTKTGFDILYTQKAYATPTISRTQLAKRFQKVSKEDLKTRGVFILTKKKKEYPY